MADEEINYTKYEKARVLGSRALQLAMGAPFLVKISDEELEAIHYNPVEIAKIEFSKGMLPITIRRPIPGVEQPEEESEDGKPEEAA